MLQTKSDLEKWYQRDDPWFYESTPDDAIRKDKILTVLETYGTFEKALDVGAGQGFLTRDLPAKELYAYELSDKAADRLPLEIQRVHYTLHKAKTFDLVVATGVFYSQYDWEEMQQFALDHANNIILTCNIKSWEIPLTGDNIEQIHYEEFPYREYTQALRVFKVKNQ